LRDLAAQADAARVYAILHPEEAIVAGIKVPPVPAQRLDAAVAGTIEPMILSDVGEVCVAHGPRAADGEVTVAWTARRPLARAWAVLVEAGLNVVAFIPQALALPANDPRPGDPLALPAGSRWLAPLPAWSLARDELRPASARGRWRRPIYWACAAAAIWVAGLNGYAAQLDNQVHTLRHTVQASVKEAFPQISVVIDPVRQARNERDALRLAQGVAADDDFISLTSAAAQVLEFAQGHVRGMRYEDGVLSLMLAEGYSPPANEAVVAQSASARQLLIAKDETQPHVWHARRAVPGEAVRNRP
jgi:general secretion pathway protein L